MGFYYFKFYINLSIETCLNIEIEFKYKYKIKIFLVCYKAVILMKLINLHKIDIKINRVWDKE